MENKYYTPELQEFHEGFEFEILLNDGPNKTVWSKWDFKTVEGVSPVNQHTNLTYAQKWIKENRVRVKYLDQEDIESLGFTFAGKTTDIWFTKEGHFNMDSWTCYKIRLHYGLHDNYMTINAIDGEDDYRLFKGKIKNKSVLKQVLKIIGVTE